VGGVTESLNSEEKRVTGDRRRRRWKMKWDEIELRERRVKVREKL
jgi:hypothetical protein